MNSKAKGKRGEREWANYFKRWFPNACRGLNQGSGASSPDVTNTPFWAECKSGKRISLYAAYFQARTDLMAARKKGGFAEAYPIVCARQDREPGVVLIGSDDFAKLLDLAYGPRGPVEDGPDAAVRPEPQ